jgi:hypothetical protein
MTYEHLNGHAFPGGTTIVPSWMNRLWADSVFAADPSPHVHPVLVYYAAVQGSGVGFQDIFDLLDGDRDAGILYAGQELTFAQPMLIDRPYAVSGGIVDVSRKQGRSTGPFDLMRFRLTIADDAGERVAQSTSGFVFPRGA